MRQAAEGTMQLVIVSKGLRVISRGTTDGNALGLFGADETVRSLCRDELMAEVGGGIGGRRQGWRSQHRSQEARPKVEEEARPKVFGHAAFAGAHKT